MKFYDVTIQMKPLHQYFHMMQFILYVVLTFESLDEARSSAPPKISLMNLLSES